MLSAGLTQCSPALGLDSRLGRPTGRAEWHLGGRWHTASHPSHLSAVTMPSALGSRSTRGQRETPPSLTRTVGEEPRKPLSADSTYPEQNTTLHVCLHLWSWRGQTQCACAHTHTRTHVHTPVRAHTHMILHSALSSLFERRPRPDSKIQE